MQCDNCLENKQVQARIDFWGPFLQDWRIKHFCSQDCLVDFLLNNVEMITINLRLRKEKEIIDKVRSGKRN